MVFQIAGQNQLYVKLAERLTDIEGDPESYLNRPPIIQDIRLLDGKSEPLDFTTTTTPNQLTFHTRLGDFVLVYQDRRTLSWLIPSGGKAGLSFHVSPQFWQKTPDGGTFKSIRNLVYQTNGKIASNLITPRNDGYDVKFLVKAAETLQWLAELLQRKNLTTPQGNS